MRRTRKPLINRLRGAILNAYLLLIATFLVGTIAGLLVYPVLFPQPHISIPEPVVHSSPSCGPHAAVTQDDLLIKLNEYRLSKGLEQMAYDPQTLQQFAKLRAPEVAQPNNFVHTTKYGGYFVWVQSQNLRVNFVQQIELLGAVGSDGTSCDVLNGFEISPTHNDGLLQKGHPSIGIGIETNSHGSYVVFEIGNTDKL